MNQIKRVIKLVLESIWRNYYRKRNIQIREETIIRKNSVVIDSSFGYLSGCNRGCNIYGAYIGNYVNIASKVSIGARDHIFQNFTTHDFIYTNGEHKFKRNIHSENGGGVLC